MCQIDLKSDFFVITLSKGLRNFLSLNGHEARIGFLVYVMG